MSIQGVLVSASVLVIAGGAAAQSDPLYITDGDSSRLAIVQGGVLQSVKTTHVRGYPIVVSNSVWIGDYNGNQPNAIEYDLAGNPTGNTVGYSPIFAVDAGFDGTTTYQLGSAFGGSGVVHAGGPQFQGAVPIFNAPGNDVVGITYDMDDNTIWVSDSSMLYEYTVGGTLLNSYGHQSGRGCIAWEPSTDSIWYVTNGSDTISQYDSDTGQFVQSLNVSGLASNNWGAEFAIPAPGAAVLLGLGGLVAGRRRR